jgi:hypothetical protein
MNPSRANGGPPAREPPPRSEVHYSEEAFHRIIKRSIGRSAFPARLNAVATERGYSRKEVLRVGLDLGINRGHLDLALAEEDVRSPLPEIPSAFGEDGICSQWTIPADRAAAQQAITRLMLKGGDFAASRRSSHATAWRRSQKEWPEVSSYRATSNGLHYVKEIVTSVSSSGGDETLVRLDARVTIRDADLASELTRISLPVRGSDLREVRDPVWLPTRLMRILTVVLFAAALGTGHAFDLFPLEFGEGVGYYAALGVDVLLWLLFLLAALMTHWVGKANAAKSGYRSIIDEKKRETLESFQKIFDELSFLSQD